MMDSNQRAELIVRTAARLTPQERAKVAEKLLEHQDGNPFASASERYIVLLKAAEEVVGRKMTRSRDMEDVMIRRFIAYRMRKEGRYITDIARAMKMNHSTIIHYVHQMQNCFDEPIFYAKELTLYLRFSEYAEDESKD